MPWPAFVIEQFDNASDLGRVDESEFYGPYNSLLTYLFPSSDHYMVIPRKYQRYTDSQSIDFTTVYLVRHRKIPVFFLEITASEKLDSTYDRATAHERMRELFESLAGGVVTDTLWGVSAIGTRLCFYRFDKATKALEPATIPRDPFIINDRAPANRWNIELLSAEGEQKLRAIAVQVKEMLAAPGN